MTEMVSHWPVLVELPVDGQDRDAEGFLTDEAVRRLFAEGRAAYAAECPELDLAAAVVGEVAVRRGSVPAPGASVAVGVAVVEVFPERFTMDAKIRPEAGEGTAGTASCAVSPAGGVSEDLRRRLIALAQSARHLH